MDKSHRSHSPHPNAHTKEEIKWIKDLLKRHKNDNLTLGKIWYKLRINKGYKRNIGSLYRVMRKLGYYKQINITGTSKYIPKNLQFIVTTSFSSLFRMKILSLK